MATEGRKNIASREQAYIKEPDTAADNDNAILFVPVESLSHTVSKDCTHVWVLGSE